MALVLTIAGVTKTLKARSLRISATANGRATASFTVISTDGTYRPALDADVILTLDGTRIFAGLVAHPVERGLLEGATSAIETQVSAYDYNQYPERRFVLGDGGFPAGYNLGQCVASLCGYLTPFGVTVDPGQVTGPTFTGERGYGFRQVSEIFNELATLTAQYGDPYVWRIDNNKLLRFYQPSTNPAPFDITTANGRAIGDVTVEISREKYANNIIIKVAPATELNRTETFTGDGSTTAFQLQYTPTRTGVVYVGAVGETLTTTAYAGTASWELNTTTNQITRVAGAPASSAPISIQFDGVFSGTATATDAGEYATWGPWDKVVTLESVPSNTTAQEIADGYLAQSLVMPKTIKYRTLGAGLQPGQTQTITIAKRNISVTGIITEVNTTDDGRRLMYDVTVTTGTTVNGGWRDPIKVWSGDKLGKAAPIVSPTTVGTGLVSNGAAAPPERAVQYCKNTSFGGSAAFIFYDGAATPSNLNSIVCGGGGSSITAADFESCQVFGYDNHITD